MFRRVLQLLAEAIRELSEKGSRLVPALVLPGAGLVASAWVPELLPSGVMYTFAAWLLLVPFYAMFAVSCHRVIILGENHLPSRLGLFWSAREVQFIGRFIAIALLIWAATVLFMLLTSALAETADDPLSNALLDAAAGVFVSYFAMRFSLVLPATALSHELSFAESWAVTRGNGLVLAVAVYLPALASWLIFVALDEAVGDAEALILDIPYIFVSLVLMVVEIGVLSIAYRDLVMGGPRDGVDSG